MNELSRPLWELITDAYDIPVDVPIDSAPRREIQIAFWGQEGSRVSNTIRNPLWGALNDE